jgi:radical SAM-linked protein
LTVLRVKFIKGEGVKYISHLDLLKTCERAMRRADAPLSYTKGFNPHPVMVFGLPLPVGVTSECEYMDVGLNKNIRPEEFIKTVNSQLPHSLSILSAWEEKENKNIMSMIVRAVYIISVCTEMKTGIKYLQGKIDSILNERSIVIGKKVKRGMKEVDIRPLIYGIEVSQCEKDGEKSEKASFTGKIEIKIRVAAGSRANLNPVVFTDFFKKSCEKSIIIQRIHRSELLIEREGVIETPEENNGRMLKKGR